MENRRYTYSGSGVDVFRNDEFTDFIKSEVKLPDWVTKEPTGYATILNFSTPNIVVTADGIGSKLLLHIEYNRWNDAAKDLIGMNYNDIVCVGGRPKAFVDYLGVKNISNYHYEFIKALNEELKKVDMALVAGETAELPSMYSDTHWDVAGFCIGVLERRLPVEEVEYGDLIIGLTASGFHSNGWSLIRKIITQENIHIQNLPFDLLTGTTIYSKVPLIFDYVKAIAHVTGGGILRALKRILKDKGWSISIKIPDYIDWILQYVDTDEALKTFNMGYGMLIVVGKEDKKKIDQVLSITGGVLIGTVSKDKTIDLK